MTKTEKKFLHSTAKSKLTKVERFEKKRKEYFKNTKAFLAKLKLINKWISKSFQKCFFYCFY